MADNDVPPLEDMSEVFQQAQKLRERKLSRTRGGDTPNLSKPPDSRTQHQKNSCAELQNCSEVNKGSHTRVGSSTTPPQTSATAKPDTSPPQQKDKKDFGGMKKGFLFGGAKTNSCSKSQTPKTSTEKTKSSETDSIPFIKPKSEDNDSSLKLTEIQEAMESASGILKDKEWVTDDLLQKVTKNETLARQLNDPKFMQAIGEFQTNPHAAMAKYQSNPEVQLFLKEFCGILGEHFTSLGDQEDKSKPKPPPNQTGPKIMEMKEGDSQSSPLVGSQGPQVPVDPQVQQILSDPANQEILMDPQVQTLMQHLRSNPKKAQKMLRESDDTLRQKVDRLISLGLLKFQA